MPETRSTCPYCGVGCGVIIDSDGPRITGVRGDPEHPANFGRLCTKGSTLHLTAQPLLMAQTRALHPMRRPRRGAPLERIGWTQALDEVAQRLAGTIEAHGPDAVGLYLSGQLLTEDYHVFNKLAKGLIGTHNVDTNSRLCMSSAVAGYKASLGADAPPACYDDLASADTVFIAGSNTAWAHPVLYRRLEDARRARPGMKVVVVDPRRTETAAEADLHLALLPGTDVALFHAMLHVMLWEGWVDAAFIEAHTQGFAALRDWVREFTPAHAAAACGLKADDIVQAARWFAGIDGTAGGALAAGLTHDAAAAIRDGRRRGATLSLYCQGLNQSRAGTDKNSALINLHLATGQIGRPGAGPLSLTGQPNAMGGREVGGLAHLLPGHREVADAAHRAEVAALWGVRKLPATPGKAAVQMFEAAADGQIRALWIVCTNPAHSMPDQTLVRRALERCEFVVLQEAYAHTATARCADLLLPAASWGEKEGSVTNSERRISRVRAAVPPPGQARADWAIAVEVARRLEARLPSRRAPGLEGTSPFAFDGPEAIWLEHRESTRGRDLDISGLTWAALDKPTQWPCPAPVVDASAIRPAHAATPGDAPEGQPRLYTDGRFATPDGRARFQAPAWQPTAEVRDARHPIALTTGRLRDQWHGVSRTGTLGRLFAHTPQPSIDLHPQDLARRGLREGQLVRVRSRRGELILPVQASDAVAPAQAFIAMHWGDEVLGGRGALGVNALMPSAHCPRSLQPELKHAAVRLEAVALPWQVVGAAWLPADRWVQVREQLRPLMAELGFACCVPFGREPADEVGLWWRGADERPPASGLVERLQQALGLDDRAALRYRDDRRAQQRALRLGADGRLQAFVLAGDAAAADWVLEMLRQGTDARAFGAALLAASPRPPQALPAGSPQVCACHDVREEAIVAACARHRAAEPAAPAGARLAAVQAELRCGTQCGSCLPALRALVERPVGLPTPSAESALPHPSATDRPAGESAQAANQITRRPSAAQPS